MRLTVFLCALLIVPSASWAQSRAALIAEATVALEDEEREGAAVVVVDASGTERVLRGSTNGLLCRLRPGVVSQCYETSTQRLFLSATTQSGRPVGGLQVGELQVRQPGAACTAVRLVPETDRMKIALLVDTNRAARPSSDPLGVGLRRFLDVLPAQHEVGLFTHAGQTRLRVDFTTDRDALHEEVVRIFAGSFGSVTALVSGLSETWERRFDDADAWPVFVLVVHHGADSSGAAEERVNRLARELRARGATVHTVLVIDRSRAREVEGGPTGQPGLNFPGGAIGLKEAVTSYLTRTTGGIYTEVVAGDNLPGALSSLAMAIGEHYEAVKDRYRVGYECEPDNLDAPVTVTVTRLAVSVRTFPDRRRSSPNVP